MGGEDAFKRDGCDSCQTVVQGFRLGLAYTQINERFEHFIGTVVDTMIQHRYDADGHIIGTDTTWSSKRLMATNNNTLRFLEAPLLLSYVGGLGGRDICPEEFYAIARELRLAVDRGQAPPPRLLYTETELRELRKLQTLAGAERERLGETP